MAFNFKKIKRQAAPDAASQDDGISSVNQSTTTSTTGNVVATQPWVYHVMGKFWKWTAFFATKALQVAGGIKAATLETNQIQTDDIYAKRLTLLDQEGRPCAIYIGEDGKIHTDYDFHDIYAYSADGCKAMEYVYRYGKDDANIARNFIGLTAFETLLNFVPLTSVKVAELNSKSCPMVCPADSEEELIDRTLLLTCPSTKKIVGLEVLDVDGNPIEGRGFNLPAEGDYKKLTINMPSFHSTIGEDVAYVQLPENCVCSGCGAFEPFLPPFMKPPTPPFPPFPMPTDDIFNDEFNDGTDIFDEVQMPSSSDSGLDGNIPFDPGQNYEVVYEDYATSTYCNLALKRSDFESNVEQFISLKLEDA